MSRSFAAVGIVAVFLIIVALAPLATAPGTSAGMSPLQSVAVTPGLGPITPAVQNCTWGGLGLNFGVAGLGNTTRDVGLAPAIVNFTGDAVGGPGNYTYSLSYGDGTFSNGSYVQNVTATQWLNFSHLYTLPASYDLNIEVTGTCTSGNSSGTFGAGQGFTILVGGPGGYTPVTLTANVTNGTVPLSTHLQVAINDSPANATILWTITNNYALSLLTFTNQTSLNLTLRQPGLYFPSVSVIYPNSNIVFGMGYLPSAYILVQPLVDIAISQSAPVSNSSATTITFFANATNLTGGPYTGPGNLNWSFPNPGGYSNLTPIVVRTGPTTGSEVTETFTVGFPGLNAWLGTYATAAFVDPSNTTLGLNYTYFTLIFGNSTGGGTGFGLTATASPSVGVAPFATNITLTSSPNPLPPLPPPVNLTAGYELDLCIAPSSLGWNSTCPTFSDTIANWTGGPTVVPVTGLPAGTYLVVANLWQSGPNGSRVFLAAGNTTLSVGVGGSGATPLTAVAAGSPLSGTAPLSTSLGVAAAGGAAPYDLSVCTEGPLSAPTGSAPCHPVSALTGWNGSSASIPLTLTASGYYDAVATVTDSGSNSTTVSLTFNVTAPANASPLQVHASSSPSTLAPGSYSFTATIQGGVAPYDIQWAFGDGTYGASTSGGTVTHVYQASGSYTATLTVTDSRGAVRASSVGPLVVVLPASSGTSLLSGASLGITAASVAVILASLVAIAYMARTAAERRRTDAWLRSLEPAPPGEQPPSTPGP